MIALIDADILVFRCGFAAERNQWFLKILVPNAEGPPSTREFQYKKEATAALDKSLPGIRSREEGVDYQLWSERKVEPVENALHNVNVAIGKIMDSLSVSEFDVKLYLSGGVNFRYAAATTKPYKGNRDDKHRPTHEEAIRKYMRSKWDTVVTDGIEADDALGIAQTAAQEGETCIVTIDKDLDMIPGFHYNFVEDVSYTIDAYTAWRKFCTQLLMGDSTDNIPGLPKVGVSKAVKMLEGLENVELMEEVARQYASKSGKEDWFEYLMEQATLLWIQQTGIIEPPIDPSLNEIGRAHV